jgi:formate-dependent nitrite reductase cytochrome c552 subunit
VDEEHTVAKPNSMACAKCNAAMEEGVIIDWGHSNYIRVASWAAGIPEKRFWGGLKVKDSIPLRTFRCPACGYLESYADQVPIKAG